MEAKRIAPKARSAERILTSGLTNPAVLMALQNLLRHLESAANAALESGPGDRTAQTEGVAALREGLRAFHELSGSILAAWDVPQSPSGLSEATVTRQRPTSTKRRARKK